MRVMRSLAFLPGNTPNMLINGDTLGADALILDLEDAVAPDQKDAARVLVRNCLQGKKQNQIYIVRINGTDTDYWKEDLEAIVPEMPDYIMPTKVNGSAVVHEVESYIADIEKKKQISHRVQILPLLETALGIERAYEIASSSERVAGIALGGEDLTADFHCKRTKEGEEIQYARTRMVCAARAAGIEVYDTPFTDVNDQEGLWRDAEKAKALGFSGKLVISPRHIDAVNECFAPTEEEIAYAQEVLRTIEEAKREGKGVVSLRGKMIDAPIVARAKQTCEMAEMLFGGRK